ncbi:MAG: TonB-dependent cobalamin receptor BtuB [Rhodobacteraceae bacterium HLUCCA08]|nr:MAG: TonB-dependent cobalamin receptor BtuB [Rhodobacteraceae bacterium HLUCCA08]
MTHLARLATPLAALLAFPATAQDSFDLGEIVVSGAFVPLDASAYGRAVTIVTSDDIARSGATTVQDAIAALPGVSVSRTDPYNTQVRIRGGEGNHTLVLIDGVEAMSGENGEYFFSGLSAADIERIEILRGPQSVIYGSNAMSGVISITTARPVADGSAYRVGYLLGSDGSWGANFTGATRSARGELSYALIARHDGGFDISGDGGAADESDRLTLNLTGRTRLGEGVEAGFTLRATDQDYDFDRADGGAADAAGYIVDADNSADRTERLGSAWIEVEAMGGQMLHRLGYEGNAFATALSDDTGSVTSDTESAMTTLGYTLSYAADGGLVETSDHVVTLLLEAQRLSFDDTLRGESYGRDSTAIALEYVGQISPALAMQASVRRDFNEEFEDATSWTLAGSYSFASGVRLHASAGQAVVNPSMYEQFGFFPGFYVGNPDLEPERSLGFDIGIETPFDGGRGLVDVTLFHEDLENEIVYAPTFDRAINRDGTSNRKGVELSVDYQVSPAVALSFDYTYLDATGADGSVEVRRPGHEAVLGLSAEAFGGDGTVTAQLRHVADLWDTQFWGSFETLQLPDYTVVDLAMTYDIADNVTLSGRIDNLLDEEVSDVWGYAGPGRAAFVGLDVTF